MKVLKAVLNFIGSLFTKKRPSESVPETTDIVSKPDPGLRGKEQAQTQIKSREYLQLLVRKEKLSAELKQLNKDIVIKGFELYDAMEDEEITIISPSGIKFETKIKRDFKLVGKCAGNEWDKTPEWFNWLRAEGEGGLITTRESIAWQTRNKFLRTRVDNNKELPPFVQETFQNQIHYTKKDVERLVQRQTNGV